MNTPRLRREGGIASSSLLFFLPVLVFLYSIFCCDSASEFGAMGSSSFLFFFCPNLLLVFLNLLFLGTYIIFLSQVLGLSLDTFLFFYFPLPYFGLACNHGNSFLCLEE